MIPTSNVQQGKFIPSCNQRDGACSSVDLQSASHPTASSGNWPLWAVSPVPLTRSHCWGLVLRPASLRNYIEHRKEEREELVPFLGKALWSVTRGLPSQPPKPTTALFLGYLEPEEKGRMPGCVRSPNSEISNQQGELSWLYQRSWDCEELTVLDCQWEKLLEKNIHNIFHSGIYNLRYWWPHKYRCASV